MQKTILPLLLSGLWITFSEFLRNEILFKYYWVDHFNTLSLQFETLPFNGILWMIWSFMLAYIIFVLLQKFSFQETLLLTWLSAFVMMRITIYNLQTLPVSLLIFAVPLSIIEIIIAGLIIKKFTPHSLSTKS